MAPGHIFSTSNNSTHFRMATAAEAASPTRIMPAGISDMHFLNMYILETVITKPNVISDCRVGQAKFLEDFGAKLHH